MLAMGKSFLPDDVNQSLLFPPSLHDWLPEGHLARFLVDVVSALDLSAIFASYEEKDGRGQSTYAPAMMVRVYGYATGVYSSRKLEAKTYDDVAFRYLSADAHPDHDTLAEFRKRHLESLAGLFTQALQLCEKAGLVKLGHVSIDGPRSTQQVEDPHILMSRSICFPVRFDLNRPVDVDIHSELRLANYRDHARSQVLNVDGPWPSL
jgi:transposase